MRVDDEPGRAVQLAMLYATSHHSTPRTHNNKTDLRDAWHGVGPDSCALLAGRRAGAHPPPPRRGPGLTFGVGVGFGVDSVVRGGGVFVMLLIGERGGWLGGRKKVTKDTTCYVCV